METGNLLARLNWFYSLELNQVDLYTAQSQKEEDVYVAHALGRIAGIEQQHVENIKGQIRDLGGKPTLLGDLLGPLLGKVAGLGTSLLGTRVVLQANIALEERAMREYKDLLLKVGPRPDLLQVLWDNLIDEDLHTAWMANKLRELQPDNNN